MKRILCVALALAGCGIEVGNPSGDKKTGTTKPQGILRLSLSDAPFNGARHVFLNVAGLSAVAVGDDGAETDTKTIAPKATGRVDVLQASETHLIELTDAQSLDAGSYGGVVLGLDASDPAALTTSDGGEAPLSLPDSARGLFVQQSFQLEAGEELSLTLHVDLERSITRRAGGDERRFDFGPIAHMMRRGDDGTISGKTALAGAAKVCAYLRRSEAFNGGEFDRLPGAHGDGPRPPHPPHERGPMSGGGRVPAQPPKSVGPGGQGPRPEDDTACAQAFATAGVTAGAFRLEHLWPGDYELRFKDASGVAIAGEVKASVAPGATVNVEE